MLTAVCSVPPLLRPWRRRRRTLATTLPLESVVPPPGWPLPSYLVRVRGFGFGLGMGLG